MAPALRMRESDEDGENEAWNAAVHSYACLELMNRDRLVQPRPYSKTYTITFAQIPTDGPIYINDLRAQFAAYICPECLNARQIYSHYQLLAFGKWNLCRRHFQEFQHRL